MTILPLMVECGQKQNSFMSADWPPIIACSDRKKALELGYEVIFLSDACQAVNLKPDDGKKPSKKCEMPA